VQVCTEPTQGVWRPNHLQVRKLRKDSLNLCRDECKECTETTLCQVLVKLERVSTRSAPEAEVFQVSKLRRGSTGRDQAIDPAEEESKAEPLKNIEKSFIWKEGATTTKEERHQSVRWVVEKSGPLDLVPGRRRSTHEGRTDPSHRI
jgi:hypothetical protein